ncbi:MAG: hypothetical protein ACLU80_00425 [Dorea sp.]
MVEQNLKIRYGQTFFRADACISRVEFHSTCNLRRDHVRFSDIFWIQLKTK